MGQARLGAVVLAYSGLARQPCAPVGQAEWGRATGKLAPAGLAPSEPKVCGYTPQITTQYQTPTGLPRLVNQGHLLRIATGIISCRSIA